LERFCARLDLLSVSRRANTVTTDPSLVEEERLGKTRCRVRGRKLCPDVLDSEGPEGEAARGDHASMRPWVSCRETRKKVLEVVGKKINQSNSRKIHPQLTRKQFSQICTLTRKEF
jgi:hypothetical protein